MTKHKTGTRQEWLTARRELLKAEKELTRRSDELPRRRQELPWVRIAKDYRFDTDEGSAALAHLFRGRSQLLIYHFMFGPEAKGFKTRASQLIAQMNAKFSGGEIGQATHLVNRFETGATGNNYFHGFQISTACFIRRTSACNSRASRLRSELPSRKGLKCTDA